MCTAHSIVEVVSFRVVHFHACNRSYSDSVVVTFNLLLQEIVHLHTDLTTWNVLFLFSI